MRSAPTDLYAILGLTPRATQAQLRQAYRAQLRRHHPDTRTVEPEEAGGPADIALQEILTAYEVLRDPARRADYDRLRAASRPDAPPDIRVRRMPAASANDPPLRAGPVRWHPPR